MWYTRRRSDPGDFVRKITSLYPKPDHIRARSTQRIMTLKNDPPGTRQKSKRNSLYIDNLEDKYSKKWLGYDMIILKSLRDSWIL